MKKIKNSILLIMLLIFTTLPLMGCLKPQEEKKEFIPFPNSIEIDMVQTLKLVEYDEKNRENMIGFILSIREDYIAGLSKWELYGEDEIYTFVDRNGETQTSETSKIEFDPTRTVKVKFDPASSLTYHHYLVHGEFFNTHLIALIRINYSKGEITVDKQIACTETNLEEIWNHYCEGTL